MTDERIKKYQKFRLVIPLIKNVNEELSKQKEADRSDELIESIFSSFTQFRLRIRCFHSIQ